MVPAGSTNLFPARYMLAKCLDSWSFIVGITWLIVWVPTVSTQPIDSATKIRKLGALKHDLN